MDNIEAVRKAPKPQTKKQVRAFLGLAGFYRKFIPNFSAIAIPLSDLTKKGQHNRVVWTESQPKLKLPDFQETFILRTDVVERNRCCLASDRGWFETTSSIR